MKPESPSEGVRRVAALARVHGRGQFTIPEAVRDAVGTRSGDTLLVKAVGPGRFEVTVLPPVTADDFFEAMALSDDLTEAEIRKAISDGVAARVDGIGRENDAFAAATAQEG